MCIYDDIVYVYLGRYMLAAWAQVYEHNLCHICPYYPIRMAHSRNTNPLPLPT